MNNWSKGEASVEDKRSIVGKNGEKDSDDNGVVSGDEDKSAS